MTVAGFPHSGITGSQPACGSPMLFAAYRALPRLSVPRHPPCALVRLTGIPSRSPSVFLPLSGSKNLRRPRLPSVFFSHPFPNFPAHTRGIMLSRRTGRKTFRLPARSPRVLLPSLDPFHLVHNPQPVLSMHPGSRRREQQRGVREAFDL